MSMLAGYALVNTCIRTPLYEAAQQRLLHLRQTGQLAAEARVASNSLLCLAPAYQGKGLMPLLLAQLNQQLASRYDVLYATVHRSNLRSMRFHQREGYQPVGQDAERIYFLKAIHAEQAGPLLDPAIWLRPGQITDTKALHNLNQQWLRHARNANLADGFLTTLYSEAEYAAMCAMGEVAVLEAL